MSDNLNMADSIPPRSLVVACAHPSIVFTVMPTKSAICQALGGSTFLSSCLPPWAWVDAALCSRDFHVRGCPPRSRNQAALIQRIGHDLSRGIES
jgi:hypothetical protein